MKKLTNFILLLFISQFLYSTNYTVNTLGMTFVPSSININVGDTVTWNNTGGFHNVNGTLNTFPNNPAGFGNSLGSGWTFTHIFTISGTYNYQCDPHLPGMIGSVNVNSPPSNSVYDIVSNSSSHTTLKTAIDACSLDGTLSGPGPFTLFAPTDAAFNLLPAGTVTALLNDIPQLTNILLHHVVGDSVMSTMLSNNQIVTTLLGTDVTVTINSTGVFIDNAMVTVADIVADNGVVHVIDAVLLPNSTSNIEQVNNIEAKYMYSVNILGERVYRDQKNQIVFDIYDNGKIIKRFKN
tara:strand:+ start:197 stop:1081 length:885 start_codon:yes stop_codon:yes gene_type:complete